MASTHQPTLLGLPRELRLRILEFALVRPCPISLSTEGSTIAARRTALPRLIMKGDQCVYKMKGGGRIVFRSEGGLDCFCPALPVSLFRLSRMIHDEAIPIFYGKNKFKLLGQSPSHLEFVHRLAPRAIASLTSLLIRLNRFPCVLGHDDMNLRGRCSFCGSMQSSSDPILTDANTTDQTLLDQWRRLCVYLAQSVEPNRLSLTLICDAKDEIVGKAVVEPLSMLPRLRKCTVRLGRCRNTDLATIARQACSQAMGHSTHIDQPFRFFGLPIELRRHVLALTDLTVCNQIQTIRISDGKGRIRASQRSYRTTCCWRCNDTRDNCCCPTVYASASADCSCRQIPFELFLVNKAMKLESEDVFFSTNCFEFDQSHIYRQHLLDSSFIMADYIPNQTLNFLSHLNPNAITSIRRIRVIFDDSSILIWPYEIKDQWRRLLRFIKEHLIVTNLCLIVRMKETDERCLHPESEQHQRYIYHVYHEIIQELSVLQGLQDLHLEFSWFRDLEASFERSIMGSRYNSQKGNKYSKEAATIRYHRSQTIILREVKGSDLPAWLVSAEFQHSSQSGGHAEEWDLERLVAKDN